LQCEASSAEKKIAFLDVNSYEDVLKCLSVGKQTFDRNLAAIEYMDEVCYNVVHAAKHKLIDLPFEKSKGKWYVLVEVSGATEEEINTSFESYAEKLED